MVNLVKMLITFTCLISICCFLVSSQNIPSQDISPQDISLQNISFIYEEPIEGLKFYTTISYSLRSSLLLWMGFEDEDPACMLPYLHLRLIDNTGNIKYIDVNYTLPAEAVCPINMDVIPLTDNYIMLFYPKTENGVKGKYGLIINHKNEVINEIYLGNARYIERSLSGKGFISIEKPDEEGIASWHLFSHPDITTGEVVERRSGKFYAPNLLSYTLVDSLNFPLIDGGFGFMYILKYDETKGLTEIKDPNLQYWKIYVSFLREGTGSAISPSLVYQTSEKLNNITLKLCVPSIYAEGYICTMALNNTITNKKDNKSQTEVNYYQLGFLSTGALVRSDIISNPTNNTDIDLRALYYGGFVAIHEIFNHATAIDFYLLDDNGSYMQSQGSFGPEFFHYNTLRINNTIFGIKKLDNNRLEFLLKFLPRLNNRSTEYICPVIKSTEPAINEVIDPSIKEITIKYTIPVKLSTANVSIFQLNDDPYKPDLLRQTFSGDSKLCIIGSDNYTVHIPIFESTFNQPNSSYYVLIENSFVVSQDRNEPLLGIREKTWKFSTKPLKMALHSESVTGLLRLNEEGSSKFLQTTNYSIFFENMIQKFSKVIPVNEQRLSTNGRWQYDPTSPKKILLSFNINEAKDDTIEPSSRTIFDNLSTLIRNKGYTELSNNEYTSLIDESAPFTMTQDYFEEFYPFIIIFIASLSLLIILYFLARLKNPKGKNSAIFETAFIIQDFAVDLAFTLLKVKNTPHLITFNLIFFVGPIVINCFLVLNIFIYEIANNPSFVTWFSEFPTLTSICTLLSAVDILALNTLSSDLFGLKVFSAPLTQRSRKIILWGSFINIFIEDVPQFIIQVFYYKSVITYDLIPSLAFASGGLVIGNKLILRSYYALVRWHHRRNEIREFNKHSHLSVGSLRSIRSNLENFNIERENYNNNNEAEEEQDLADISIESIWRNHRTATD